MKRVPMWRRYLVFWGRQPEADLEKEFRFHLDMRTQELIDAGMDAQAARKEAERYFGDLKTFQSECNAIDSRVESRVAFRERLNQIGIDAVYALRQLIRRPSHTFAVVMCLAAGLTVSIATFSILTAVGFGDQPGIRDRKMMVRAFVAYDTSEGNRVWGTLFSVDDFAGLRDAGPALGSLAAEADLRMAAVGRHGAIGLAGAFVSGNYFEVLGTPLHAGRLLTEFDERADAPPVVLVSDHFWRTHLDSAEDSIGSTILIAGRSFTVIGVAPPRFHGLHALEIGEDDSKGLQLWIPLQHALRWPGAPSRNEPWLTTIGRLRAGRTANEAKTQLALRAAQLPRTNAAILLQSLGSVANSPPLEILAVISALLIVPLTVLAIACANVANLQLARAAERGRELAVRLSLGARRGQLIRLLTIETSTLAALALGVAGLATFGILRFAEPYFPVQLSIDWQAAAFSLVLVMAVTLATGLAPAWHVMRGLDATRLKETAQGGGRGQSRLRSSLVVAQVTLSLLMLSSSIVFLRSVGSMQLAVPAALRSQIVVEFDPAQAGSSPVEASRFAEALRDRMQADPRVKAVALSRATNIRHSMSAGDAARGPKASLVEITRSWLAVMDIPVLTGRPLTDSDRIEGSKAALVSASLAGTISPTGSPLGKILYINDGHSERSVEIVGVVADHRTRPQPKADRPDPVVYLALPLGLDTPFTINIGTDLVDAVSADLRTIVRELDPRLPWLTMRRGDEPYLRDAGELQTMALSTAGLALIAVALAATGLYALLGYVVQLRRREIGVRIAIGAEPRQIVRMILRQAFKLTLIGGFIGVGLAIPLSLGLRSVVVGTGSVLDPVALGPPFLLLLVVALIAAVLPAWRAARIDPMTTLRQD